MISVILPVYNCEKYVSNAIISILNQTYDNLELLVCDDGSIDSSIEKIKDIDDSRIRVFRNSVNLGSLKTRNFLFSRIRGKYIAFQDADDLSHPDKLLTQFMCLDGSDNGMCGTWVKYFRKNRMIREKKTPLTWEEIRKIQKQKNPFCSASIMFHSEILKNTGGYREYFADKGNYDYDLTSRIVQQFPSVNIPEFLYNVRILDNSNSNAIQEDYPIKFESEKIVRFLISEREMNNTDSLETRNEKQIKSLEDELLAPYKKNKILVFDLKINRLLFIRSYRSALILSFKALITDRCSFKSIYLILYTFRKILTGQFFHYFSE